MWFTAWKLDIGLGILAWSYQINREIVIGEETFFQAIIFHIRNVSLEVLLPQITGENHNCCKWEGGWSMQKFFLIKVSWKDLKISLSWTTRKKNQGLRQRSARLSPYLLAESKCAFIAQQKATYRQELFATRGRNKKMPGFKKTSHRGLWPACQW